MRLVWLVAAVLALACRAGGAERTGSTPPPAALDAAAPAPPVASGPAPSPDASSTVAASEHDAAAPADAATGRHRIYIQPLGAQLPDETVAFVSTSLRAFYDFDVPVLDRVPLPDWALNQARTRYRAEKLLRLLEERRPADGFRILGLTGVDISTTKGKYPDWGILGLATIDGRVCVISSFRTRRLARSKEHARVRLGKTAVHEIGHTLGLKHCPNRGCLMEDAQGTVLTTDREYDLCQDCRAELRRRGHPLADSSVPIPWPRP